MFRKKVFEPEEIWTGTLDGHYQCKVVQEEWNASYLYIDVAGERLLREPIGYDPETYYCPLEGQIERWRQHIERLIEIHKRWS